MWITWSGRTRGSHLTKPGYRKNSSEDFVGDWKSSSVTFLCVADGVSQVRKGGEAASLAVAHSRIASVSSPSEDSSSATLRDWLGSCLVEAAEALRGHAKVSPAEFQDEWKTTLCLTAIWPDNRVGIASIGDSIVALRTVAGQVIVPVSPAPSRKGVTTLDRVRSKEDVTVFIVELPDIDAVVVSTDGLDLFPTSRWVDINNSIWHHIVTLAGGHKYGELLHEIDMLEHKMPPEDYRRKGDDRGIAVATKH